MKLYLPYAFTMTGKDGKTIEHKAGSVAVFDDDLAATLMDRFGATLVDEPDTSDEKGQEEKKGDKPSDQSAPGAASGKRV